VRNGIFLLAGVCAMAVLAAGCGGSSGDSTITESSISKDQYIIKANGICERGTKKIQTDFGVFLKEKENVTKPTNADYTELYEKVLAPNVSAEIEELRELGAPKGDGSEIEAILVAREGSMTRAEEDPEAIVNDSKKVFGKASKLAGDYGLKLCANR
jgi:hypothetical protein